MRKRFIILTDLTDDSSNLLRYAYEWSVKIDAELVLVHNAYVLSPALADQENKQILRQLTNDEALAKLKFFAQNILPAGVFARYIVSNENLLDTIIQLLREPFENLILLSLKEKNFLRRIFVRNTSIQIIDHVHNITVAVPKNLAIFSLKHIYVAVSSKYPLNIISFNKLLEYAKGSIEKINFFSLLNSERDAFYIEKYLRELRDMYKDKYDVSYDLYYENNVHGSIKNIIDNQAHELLVIQKGTRLIADYFFRKFVVDELIHDGETPLVVLP